MTVQITQGLSSILTTRMRIYPEDEAEVEGGGTGTGVRMETPTSKHLARSTASSEGSGPWKDLMQQTGEEILTGMWIRQTTSRTARLKSRENTARSREGGVKMNEDLA